MTREPRFPLSSHQNGSLPFLAGKGKIERGFHVLLGTLLVSHDELLHGLNGGRADSGRHDEH